MPQDVYLDIETSFAGAITVIGAYLPAPGPGFLQLVGDDVRAAHLLEMVPEGALLFTFNGHGFDLPVIKKRLKVDLRTRGASVDLRYAARKAGLRGGLKRIETQLGIGRETAGVGGRDAMDLWARWEAGRDREALAILLAYNREDCENLAVLRREIEAIAGPEACKPTVARPARAKAAQPELPFKARGTGEARPGRGILNA